jgi:hypothetical protein
MKPEGALDTAKQQDIEGEAAKYKPSKQSIYRYIYYKLNSAVNTLIQWSTVWLNSCFTETSTATLQYRADP